MMGDSARAGNSRRSRHSIARHVSAGVLALKRLQVPLGTAFKIAAMALREIFDEAAYERYLKRTGSIDSRESFSAFVVTSSKEKERRARCC